MPHVQGSHKGVLLVWPLQVTSHWLHTASLGSTMGEPMGGELAIVQLWNPTQGVGGLGFAQLAAVLLPAGCWQESLWGCCTATTEMFPSF